MLSIFFLHISVFFHCYYSFNIDTNYPIVYEDPSKYLVSSTDISSYFGYSLVLYPGKRSSKPWVLIGAPKGADTNKPTSGVCFKCGIAEACEIFDINAQSKSARVNYEEKIDSAWLGGSMDINYKSERIVTCAPRWIKVKRGRESKSDDYHMQGACYWFHTDDNSTQKLLPLFEPNRDVYTHPSGGSVYNFAQGQAGFSVHMPVKANEMILGAPGVYNWDGTTILYKDNIETSPVASRLQNRGRNSRNADPSEFSYKNIANAIETKQTLAYDLLGYATSSGYFYSKKELLYVSSAPRSDYTGQILIYEFDKGLEKPLGVKESKHGQQFGEYFGSALTVGDINNDGLDDLIVGAPFHMAQKYNEGKIYIFLGSKSGRLQEPKRNHIVGKSASGQFGTTVQYLGDINHDRYGDVAVAAPYEDEKSGVVYLFRGTADGLETNFCQRILGKNVYQSIQGFGMSISRAVDIDFNRYPDVAIGAYLSGHVVVLRSRPVITIHQELISLAPHLNFKTRSFEMRECFSYYLDQMDPGNISINRTLTLDQQLGRAYLEGDDDYVKVISLRPQQKTCQNFTVKLTSSFSNRYDPVTVSLSHTFRTQTEHKQVLYVNQNQNQPRTDSFCPRCPVYNAYGSISSSTMKVPYALGCKSSNICRSSLEMDLKIIDIGDDNTFVLGAKNYLTLQIDIKNSGEKAYLTQVLATVPDSITFRSTPSACTEKNSSSVMCSVDNPLDTKSQKSVTLDLDMTTINTGKYDDSLTFLVELFTSSENNGDKIKTLVIKLTREADVFITGKSEEQSYSYRNISEGKPHFTQIYQVEKFGRSSLNEILVEINIPRMFKTEDGREILFTSLYPPIGTLAEQDVSCTSDFTYIFEEKQNSNPIDFEGIEETAMAKEQSKRFVRQVQVFNKSTTVKQRLTKENELESLQNRTYYVNCTMNEVVCSKVKCTTGSLKSGEVVKIKLSMVLDIAAVKDLLGKKDVVLFATQGRVVVTNPKNFIQSGDKPDSVDGVSLFIGESQSEDIALWIVIASAIAGLLILLLLVVVLIKAGFFKRTTKDELEQLKNEMEYSTGTNLTEKEQEDESYS